MIKVETKNYVGKKYLLTNLKQDEKLVFKAGGFLRTYDINFPIKDVVTKTYYDTPDLFFQNIGILIFSNDYKHQKKCELVLRYESSINRIQFLSNIPDTLIFKINKYERINNLYSELEEHLLKIYPTGFGIDIKEKVKQLKPFLEVTKKRKRYKAINPNGLKVIMSFENCVYVNKFNGKNKVKLPILETRLEGDYKIVGKHFENFGKELILQNTNFIQISESDFKIGDEYLAMSLNLSKGSEQTFKKDKQLKPIKQLKGKAINLKKNKNSTSNEE